MSAKILVNRSNSLWAGINLSGRPASRDFVATAVLSLVHLPLGLGLYNAGPLAILHPAAAFGLGIFLAAKRQAPLASVALVAGYIVGAEVLWRMAGIPIFWESGKYMSTVILVVALLRRHGSELPLLPVAYLACLIPGCLVAAMVSNVSRTAEILSFNMSGPILLVVCCWFFHHARLSPSDFRRLLIAITLPLLSVAFTTLFYTVSNEDLQFTGESNFATSGGFGPNQVSSMLGLGVFLSLAGLVLFKKHSRFKAYFIVSALFLAALSLMTFSRGGIYNALGAVAVLIIHEFRDIATGLKRLVPVLVVVAVFLFVVFPYLNAFTGGALEERFEDTGSTNRWEIIEADVEIFLENPLLGVGVGEAYQNRGRFLEFKAASHTEFSRLVSEHGFFGLAALAFLALMVVTNRQRPNSRLGKAFIAGAITWSCLFMLNAGMRLAAPSFMLGMTYATIVGHGVKRIGRPE